MSTLANNFMQGANFVRQTERDVHQERLAEQHNQRQQERHQSAQKAASLQSQIAADQHREWQGNSDNRSTLTNLQVKEAQKSAERQDETYKSNKARTETLEGREDIIWKLTQDDNERKKNLTWLQENSEVELYNLGTTGEMSPEYFVRSRGTAFDISKLIDSNYTSQLDFMAAALNPNDSRANPKDARFLVSMNTVFKDEVNRGLDTSKNPETGSPAVGKKIVSARPVDGKPGDFYVELEVTYQDGTVRTEPMTKGRDSDPNGELGVVNTGDLVQQVSARKAFSDMVKRSGLDEKYKQYSTAIAKKKANAANAGSQVVSWNGQQVKVEQLQEQYKLMSDQWREGDKEAGISPLITFHDYLWTQGDPAKMGVLQKVVERNQQVDAYNLQADEDTPKLVRASIQEVWAALNQGEEPSNSSEDGAAINSEDPNEGVLAAILDNPKPTDINNEPGANSSQPGRVNLGRGDTPQPTRRIRTPQGAMRSSLENMPPPEPKEVVPVGKKLSNRRDNRSQR